MVEKENIEDLVEKLRSKYALNTEGALDGDEVVVEELLIMTDYRLPWDWLVGYGSNLDEILQNTTIENENIVLSIQPRGYFINQY